MDKELEALDRLYCEGDLDQHKKDYEFLKNALAELKAIKEADPSEALKCVDILKEDGCITTLYEGKALETIRQSLLKAQSNELILKIINKKTVSIFQLRCCKNVNEYNDLKFTEFEKLTQEEFVLLKRWIEK